MLVVSRGVRGTVHAMVMVRWFRGHFRTIRMRVPRVRVSTLATRAVRRGFGAVVAPVRGMGRPTAHVVVMPSVLGVVRSVVRIGHVASRS